MIIRRITASLTAVALAGTALLATTAPAQSAESKPGKQSLAKVLAADGNRFDRNAGDFDILDRAVRTVLKAKPDSAVGVLADGSVRLTAFAPTDQAFRLLVADLTGKTFHRERKVFNTLAAAAGVDTIESVLLYHVVPGATIGFRKARMSDGARLDTALEGSSVKIKVPHRVIVSDADKNDRDARVIFKLRNINKGNLQIAHGINRVLRPIDL
jgi:uncharacterized surface protein with fasciclin (FAS1) repeats